MTHFHLKSVSERIKINDILWYIVTSQLRLKIFADILMFPSSAVSANCSRWFSFGTAYSAFSYEMLNEMVATTVSSHQVMNPWCNEHLFHDGYSDDNPQCRGTCGSLPHCCCWPAVSVHLPHIWGMGLHLLSLPAALRHPWAHGTPIPGHRSWLTALVHSLEWLHPME